MPVLPPTEESTWASSDVGIWMNSTPRRRTAAANPGQIADHAAAEGDDRVAALDAGGQQARRTEPFKLGEGLGALAGGQDDGTVLAMPAAASDAFQRSAR